MLKKDILLAIETSCDETSIAIIRNGIEVLSLVTASSIDLHQDTKGVIPEVAARAQLEYIQGVFDKAISDAGVKIDNLDGIAVTTGPGLIGSLLVGVSFANTLSLIHDKPIYGVNHIHGHIYANTLGRNVGHLKFPAVVLTVSGGHNEIQLWKELRGSPDSSLKLIGETLDDSAGEAFDKCGRLIGLDYPAGPELSKLAETGNKSDYVFPRGMSDSGDFNFSFSGLKTAFIRQLQELKSKQVSIDNEKANLASSLQEAICDILATKTISAYRELGASQIHLSGGVSANKRLRQMLEERTGLKIYYPKQIQYCTDNGAMIGAAAYFQDIEGKQYVSVNM